MNTHQKKKKMKLPDDTFIFDEHDAITARKNNRPNLLQRLGSFFSSRYALITLLCLMMGSLIFYETASLQLNPSTAAGISESVGVPRQQTIRAPRGDIIDAGGLPLAWSESIDKLYLAYAGLDSHDLNARLLDLALFLEAHEVDWQSNLTRYLDLEYPQVPQEIAAGDRFLRPVWQQDIDEILFWQQNRNLFNLREPDGSPVTFDDRQAKADPQVFYDYLLYERFRIEDPQSDGQRYSQDEAFRIMQLRYLIFENNWAFINGTPVEVARDIPDAVVHAVHEQNYRFMGVITSRESERVYSSQAADIGHVLGYIGRISAAQFRDLRGLGYHPDAMIGQAGVEASAERYLAGQDGIKPYNIWTVAEDAGFFFSERIGKDPVPGNHVRLTLDMRLQQVAVDSLERVIQEIRENPDPDSDNLHDADAGSVVMIDVNTGAVLAMASSPGYDPSDFLKQSWDEDAAARVQEYLTDNQNKPMLNRTMMEIYAPGSTFKPVTAVAGLESGTITPASSVYTCIGHEIIGEWPWSCLSRPRSGHGDLTLIRGMATSCNMYFFHLGVNTGINQIDAWGRALGLGEYTGIDLPGEVRGFRASRETKILLRNNPSDQIWFPADTCQTAIGQFDNSFTILQLAVYTATLATGNRVTPYVIADITRPDGTVVLQKQPQLTPAGISEVTLAAVRESMLAVTHTNEGTASRAFADFPIRVASKTGTAETGLEDFSSSNGLFICYAPADNPQVAIAQIIEKGRWGSNTIEIARDLLEAYFMIDQEPDLEPVFQPGWTDWDATILSDQNQEEDSNPDR